VLALLCCLTSLALAANPPVAAISGIALNQFGQPLAYAQMRICSVTSTGTPCTPPSTVYQDYALTIPIGSPATDQYGNYLFYAPALDYPNLYEIQISAGQGLYWTYVQNGPSSGSGGGGSATPGLPQYSVQTNYPTSTFHGAGDLLDLTPILGPLTSTGDGLDFEFTDAGTYSNGGAFIFAATETAASGADCPACFIVNTSDTYGTSADVPGGGDIALNAYSKGSGDGPGASGGSLVLTANSPFAGSETEGPGAPGTVFLQSNTDAQADGLNFASTIIGAETYDALAGSGADLANILIRTCYVGNPVAYQSCDVNVVANGTSASPGATQVGNVNLSASSSGNSSSGQINLSTNPTAGPVDGTEGTINLQGAAVNIFPTVAPYGSYASFNLRAVGSAAAAQIIGVVDISQNPAYPPPDDVEIVSSYGEPTILSLGEINIAADLASQPPSGGAADLTVTPHSTEPAAKFNGPVIVTPLGSSTSPVCPNGTGGALTITGCLTGPITSIEANGTPITPSAGAVNLAAGTNVTLTTVGNTTTITSSATAATAFSALTTATNTSAAMTVGSGASLGTSGTGTITATGMPASGLTGTALPSGIVSSSLTSAAGGSFGTAAYVTAPANTTSIAHQFFTAYNSGTGAFSVAQPAFTDISGTPSTTQVPFQSLTTTGTTGAATLSSGILNVPNYTYTLPTATNSVLGGVKPDGTSILNSSGVISVTPTSVGLGNVTNFTQTKAAIMPNTSPTSGQIPVGNSGGTAYAPVTVSGDATLASTGALTVNSSGGVAFGTGAFSAAPTITAIQNATVAVTPSAGAINFAPGANMTLTTTGNTITLAASSTAATAFSALTGSTNTSAAMVVGSGASLAVSGTGTIAATTATTATNFTGSLAGDVTGTQSATSVGKINGGSIPASAPVVGTNGAGQIVAGPSSLPPNGSAGGDLSGSYPNPTVAKVNGLAVPTSQTVVGTNGSGQFIAGPSSLPPNGAAGGDLSGSYPNPTVAKINGGTVPTSAPLLATNSSAAPVAVTITGLIKGNGSSAVTAAVAGTDYLTPTGSGASLTGITSSQVGAIQKVASGTIALPTSSIATGTCATATATATGALTTDVLNISPNADITGVTGYAPTGQIVQIYPPWLTAGQVNVKVCNPSANSSAITPGAVTLVWNVGR